MTHRRGVGNGGKVGLQVQRIRERDGDDCWLCLYPIDFGITDPGDPMHWSRDHVVPRAAGGPDAVLNMKLAHRKCNSDRRMGGYRTLPADGSTDWDDQNCARQPDGGRVLPLR